MPTDKSISRGLFPRGVPIFFGLCTSPPSYQSIKKKIRSIHIALLEFWVGTKFECRQTKPSPEGYSHAERQFFFGLCTSPPPYQSIKKRISSIPITLLKIWVGTRFVTPKGKNTSPEGYSHTERQFFFYSAHLLIHTNLLKKKVSRYLRRFSNFGWGHDL